MPCRYWPNQRGPPAQVDPQIAWAKLRALVEGEVTLHPLVYRSMQSGAMTGRAR